MSNVDLPALVLLDCIGRARQLLLSLDETRNKETLTVAELLHHFYRDLHDAYRAANQANGWCNQMWASYLVHQQIPSDILLMFNLSIQAYEVNLGAAQACQKLLFEKFGLVVETGIPA